TRVSNSLDAAALAAAKMLDDESYSDDDIIDRANRFFAAQFDGVPVQGVTIAGPLVQIDRVEGTVDVSVDVSVRATFAQVAGIPSFDFPRSTRVTYRQKEVELGMVLDITGSMCSPCSKINGLKSAAKTLVANLITSEAAAEHVRIAVVPYSGSVNVGTLATVASGGASRDNCVVERPGANNATDATPTGGDVFGVSTSRLNRQYACPRTEILPMTSDATTLTQTIDALSTGGFTAGHIGLAWGWYLISEKWRSLLPVDSKPKPATPKIIKAVLLMTDGEFNTSYLPGSGFNSTRISVAGSSPKQAQQLCESMKNDGILVYTVAFQAPAAAQSLLSSCATSQASAFSANTNDELIAAFRTIAERLSALRISL
ncbi:MAG: hypothetical protein ACK5JT_21120, partial [Hyphomicrobiaceae bacterium]